ncbi:hypothetical protein AAVH_29954 [Aphelenchoides avenae]|nr:hypothetical protein AAVH_29954 [Aphelenchus avenae]
MSKEVDHVTTNSVWTCFANAEAYDPEWTHFYFDASSSRCSLRDGLVSFDFTALSPTGTEAAPLPGNFYVKDVAGLLAGVDGCPAETVLRALVCALPQPLPPRPADCNALESLVLITSANETALTNALFRGKCNDYGPDFYAATAPYHRLVDDVLWNETLTVAQRIEQAAVELDSVADDEDPTKEDLLAFPVGGWGTICDFLADDNSQHFARTYMGCYKNSQIFRCDDDPQDDDPEADDSEADDPEANDSEADDSEADDPETDYPQADDSETDNPQAADPQADNLGSVQHALTTSKI